MGICIPGPRLKEDIPDIRSSRGKEIIKELKKYDVDVVGFYPELNVADLPKQSSSACSEKKEIRKSKLGCPSILYVCSEVVVLFR